EQDSVNREPTRRFLTDPLRRRAAQAFELGALPFLLEPPLSRGGRRPRRTPPPLDPEGRPERLDEAPDGELAVAPLAALVLRDRPQDGPRLGDHAPLLRRRERRRGLDVEERLDSRFGALRVLAARAARA